MSVPVDAAPVFRRRRSSSRTFRAILSCRSIDVEEDEEDEPMTTMMTEDMAAEEYPEQLVRSASSPASSSSSSSSSSVLPRPATQFTACHRATLILKTRKENEPLIRVLRGTCKLKGLQLRHVCHGTGRFKIYYYSCYSPLCSLITNLSSMTCTLQTFGTETLPFKFSLLFPNPINNHQSS